MGTCVRAVTLPVESPLDETWDTISDALRVAFALSTDLANWAVHRLFRLDTPGAGAPDAVRGCYLYGAAVQEFPDWDLRAGGATKSAGCILRAVQSKYLQSRFAIQVRHESALLTYRYPYPFPVHNQQWLAYFAKGWWPGDAPVVELPLPVVGRVKLRLKRGPEFGRQLGQLRQLIDGTAKRGEAALYRDRKGNLLVKLVGHFPRAERTGSDNVAFVHTDPNALLVVEINGRPANVTNADHIRREIAKHKTMLQRTRQDKKREVRMDRQQRRNLNKYVATRCGKQQDRLKTFVQQVAAQVAKMCDRQRVGLIFYDDADTAYMPDGFPWHALKERLSRLVVGEMGCEWTDGRFAHLKDEKEKLEWLANPRTLKALSSLGQRRVRAMLRQSAGRSHPAVSTPSATAPSSTSTPSKTSPAASSRSKKPARSSQARAVQPA